MHHAQQAAYETRQQLLASELEAVFSSRKSLGFGTVVYFIVI